MPGVWGKRRIRECSIYDPSGLDGRDHAVRFGYHEMNITGITGINPAQKIAFKALGAVER